MAAPTFHLKFPGSEDTLPPLSFCLSDQDHQPLLYVAWMNNHRDRLPVHPGWPGHQSRAQTGHFDYVKETSEKQHETFKYSLIKT